MISQRVILVRKYISLLFDRAKCKALEEFQTHESCKGSIEEVEEYVKERVEQRFPLDSDPCEDERIEASLKELRELLKS